VTAIRVKKPGDTISPRFSIIGTSLESCNNTCKPLNRNKGCKNL